MTFELKSNIEHIVKGLAQCVNINIVRVHVITKQVHLVL